MPLDYLMELSQIPSKYFQDSQDPNANNLHCPDNDEVHPDDMHTSSDDGGSPNHHYPLYLWIEGSDNSDYRNFNFSQNQNIM